ncbi:MAG: ATP phosphoribosyltransferase regulatory subunit, partial [Alphaproteobacteria bacterium]
YDAGGEPATGFTLFVETVRRALPERAPRSRLFLPLGTAAEERRRLAAEGWVVVAGLDAAADAAAEARRLGCGHAYLAGKPVVV